MLVIALFVNYGYFFKTKNGRLPNCHIFKTTFSGYGDSCQKSMTVFKSDVTKSQSVINAFNIKVTYLIFITFYQFFEYETKTTKSSVNQN